MSALRVDRLASLYIFHPLCKWKRNSGIPILMYHSISDEKRLGMHEYYQTGTSPEVFSAQMDYLHTHGYSVIPLTQAVQNLAAGIVPENTVVITFDDGCQDFYTAAFPILSRHSFAATMFLPTGFVSDTELSFKNRSCLTWPQVRELYKAGVEFGSHTVSHPHLERIPFEQATEELRNSRATLEEKLGTSVAAFSYPFGFPESDAFFKENFRVMLMDAGYKFGVSTIVGTASPAHERFFLPRLPINSHDDLPFFIAKLEGGYNWVRDVQFTTKLTRQRIRLWKKAANM